MTETVIILFIFGASLGSFLNVCAYRIPRGIPVISIRSACPCCHHILHWYELIPLVSFGIQGGLCSACRQRISWRYPLFELAAALTTVLLFLKFGFTWEFPRTATFILLMLTVAISDWESLVVPNKFILVGLVAGLLFVVPKFNSLLWAVFSSVAAVAFLALVRSAGNRIFNRESMGLGDTKLAALVGLFLGLKLFLVSLWIAAFLGTGLLAFAKTTSVLRSSSPPFHGNYQSSILDSQSSIAVAGAGHSDLVPFGSLLAIASSFVIVFADTFQDLLDQWLTLTT